MEKLTFQRLDLAKAPVGDPIAVPYNPPEYTLRKGAQFAEVAIPGLDAPVLQFVRGESETLALELFFDTSEEKTLLGERKPVTEVVDPLYRLVKVDGNLHAPPIVRLTWGDHFPGTSLESGSGPAPSRPVPSFDAVAESAERHYTLFAPDGMPLRATLALRLKEYKTLEEQLRELNLRSADHTRVHVVSEGETLPGIAHAAYGDPRRWRTVAAHNGLRDVRTLAPGLTLELPPIA